MPRYRLTAAAEADLEAIGDFIARESPDRARRFVVSLRERCKRIVQFPDAAPLRHDLGDGIRLVIHRGYVVLYAVRDGTVVIERVLHGARDLPRHRA